MRNPVNERFLKAFEALRDRGIITSQKEFAQACDFPEPHFGGFRTGKRNVGIQHITNLYIHYGVSLTYMLIGKEPMMDEDAKKETAPELARQLERERQKVELLQKEREQLLKLIAFYEEALKEHMAK